MTSVLGKITVIKRNGNSGSQYPVTSKSCLFGRDAECEIRIQLPTVSTQECKLEHDENGNFILSKIDGGGELFLNDELVETCATVYHNDVLKIAGRSFRFEYPPSMEKHRVLLSAKKKYTPKSKLVEMVRQSERRRVSFGPQLSPEQFIAQLPPNTPVRKGGIPKMPSLDESLNKATPVPLKRKRISQRNSPLAQLSQNETPKPLNKTLEQSKKVESTKKGTPISSKKRKSGRKSSMGLHSTPARNLLLSTPSEKKNAKLEDLITFDEEPVSGDVPASKDENHQTEGSTPFSASKKDRRSLRSQLSPVSAFIDTLVEKGLMTNTASSGARVGKPTPKRQGQQEDELVQKEKVTASNKKGTARRSSNGPQVTSVVDLVNNGTLDEQVESQDKEQQNMSSAEVTTPNLSSSKKSRRSRGSVGNMTPAQVAAHIIPITPPDSSEIPKMASLDDNTPIESPAPKQEKTTLQTKKRKSRNSLAQQLTTEEVVTTLGLDTSGNEVKMSDATADLESPTLPVLSTTKIITPHSAKRKSTRRSRGSLAQQLTPEQVATTPGVPDNTADVSKAPGKEGTPTVEKRKSIRRSRNSITHPETPRQVPSMIPDLEIQETDVPQSLNEEDTVAEPPTDTPKNATPYSAKRNSARFRVDGLEKQLISGHPGTPEIQYEMKKMDEQEEENQVSQDQLTTASINEPDEDDIGSEEVLDAPQEATPHSAKRKSSRLSKVLTPKQDINAAPTTPGTQDEMTEMKNHEEENIEVESPVNPPQKSTPYSGKRKSVRLSRSSVTRQDLTPKQDINEAPATPETQDEIPEMKNHEEENIVEVESPVNPPQKFTPYSGKRKSARCSKGSPGQELIPKIFTFEPEDDLSKMDDDDNPMPQSPDLFDFSKDEAEDVPAKRNEEVTENFGISRIMKTPKEKKKNEPVEDHFGTKRLMKTPRQKKKNSPVEENFGTKRLLKTPREKKMIEPVEDNFGTERMFSTPGVKESKEDLSDHFAEDVPDMENLENLDADLVSSAASDSPSSHPPSTRKSSRRSVSSLAPQLIPDVANVTELTPEKPEEQITFDVPEFEGEELQNEVKKPTPRSTKRRSVRSRKSFGRPLPLWSEIVKKNTAKQPVLKQIANAKNAQAASKAKINAYKYKTPEERRRLRHINSPATIYIGRAERKRKLEELDSPEIPTIKLRDDEVIQDEDDSIVWEEDFDSECSTPVNAHNEEEKEEKELGGKFLSKHPSKTRKEKGEPVEEHFGTKRLMKTPRVPKKNEPVEDHFGTKRLLKTPREKKKNEPVEDHFGTRRMMKTPRQKRKNSPVEENFGTKRLLKTPREKKTIEPVEDNFGTKRMFTTPGPRQKNEAISDHLGTKRLLTTPKEKVTNEPVEEHFGTKRLFQTPREKLEMSLMEDYGTDRLFESPVSKDVLYVEEVTQEEETQNQSAEDSSNVNDDVIDTSARRATRGRKAKPAKKQARKEKEPEKDQPKEQESPTNSTEDEELEKKSTRSTRSRKIPHEKAAITKEKRNAPKMHEKVERKTARSTRSRRAGKEVLEEVSYENVNEKMNEPQKDSISEEKKTMDTPPVEEKPKQDTQTHGKIVSTRSTRSKRGQKVEPEPSQEVATMPSNIKAPEVKSTRSNRSRSRNKVEIQEVALTNASKKTEKGSTRSTRARENALNESNLHTIKEVNEEISGTAEAVKEVIKPTQKTTRSRRVRSVKAEVTQEKPTLPVIEERNEDTSNAEEQDSNEESLQIQPTTSTRSRATRSNKRAASEPALPVKAKRGKKGEKEAETPTENVEHSTRSSRSLSKKITCKTSGVEVPLEVPQPPKRSNRKRRADLENEVAQNLSTVQETTLPSSEGKTKLSNPPKKIKLDKEKPKARSNPRKVQPSASQAEEEPVRRSSRISTRGRKK